MRTVLVFLFDHVQEVTARLAVQSPTELSQLRVHLDASLRASGDPVGLPVGETGDNLLMALIALRLKFSAVEAFEKLEINIAMRERRTGGQGVQVK